MTFLLSLLLPLAAQAGLYNPPAKFSCVTDAKKFAVEVDYKTTKTGAVRILDNKSGAVLKEFAAKVDGTLLKFADGGEVWLEEIDSWGQDESGPFAYEAVTGYISSKELDGNLYCREI
jgi:hypothetical protein